jgi:type I restriction enzyme S subunit
MPADGWERNYLFCLFQQREFRDDLAQSASGTSNSHQRVRPEYFLSKSIVIPSERARKQFAVRVAPMMQQSEALQAESATLVKLRDYLLPKLLTGSVQVKDRSS